MDKFAKANLLKLKKQLEYYEDILRTEPCDLDDIELFRQIYNSADTCACLAHPNPDKISPAERIIKCSHDDQIGLTGSLD